MTAVQTRNTTIAILGSVLLNAGLLSLLLLAAVAYSIEHPQEDSPAEEEMVVEIVEETPAVAVEAVAAAVVEPAASPQPMGLRFLSTQGVPGTANPNTTGRAPFESNKNTEAASEAEPVTGADPTMGSQEGAKDLPTNIANKTFQDGEADPAERKQIGIGTAKQEPVAQDKPPEKPAEQKSMPAEKPPATKEEDDQISGSEPAIATPKPAMEMKPPAPLPAPVPPESQPSGNIGLASGQSKEALQSFTEKNKIAGGAKKRGISSMDAVDTPQGRYMARIQAEVDKYYQPKSKQIASKLKTGRFPVMFDVDGKGSVSNIDVHLFQKGSEVNQDLCIESILRSKMPPIPAELMDHVIDGKLPITLNFTCN